jgi:hypothetical protein
MHQSALNVDGILKLIQLVSFAEKGKRNMNSHVAFALAHPVFNPETQIVSGHFWFYERLVSAILTCNIGME